MHCECLKKKDVEKKESCIPLQIANYLQNDNQGVRWGSEMR